MANKKFSAFTVQTELSNFDGLVGFQSASIGGSNKNYYITVPNFYNDLQENLNLSNFSVGVLPIERGGTNAGTKAEALDSITDADNQNEFDILSIQKDSASPGAVNVAVFRKQTLCCKVVISGTSGLSNTANSSDFLIPYNTQAVNDDSTVYAPVLTGTGQGSVQVLKAGRYFIKVIYATFDLRQTALPSVQGNKFMRITVATDSVAAGLGNKEVLLDDIIVPTSGNGEATIEGEAILDLDAGTFIKIIGFHDGALDISGSSQGFPVNNNALFNQPSLWICKIA